MHYNLNPPSCLKVKMLHNQKRFCLYTLPSTVRTMQLQNFGWRSSGLEGEEGNGRPILKHGEVVVWNVKKEMEDQH